MRGRMKSRQVICDACGEDLTYTGNCEDYYLVVTSASKQPWYLRDGLRGGAVTSMAIRPPVEQERDFCGLACLDLWRARENYARELRRQWFDKWVDEHGERHAVGYSYPEPSQEVRDTREREIAAQVAERFPAMSEAVSAERTQTKAQDR